MRADGACWQAGVKMPLDKLHSGLKRMGAVNGSVIEVTKDGVPMSIFADDRR